MIFIQLMAFSPFLQSNSSFRSVAFGVTKRLIVYVNRLDIANIQSFHIAQVVCSFMSTANPSNVVQSFENAAILLITADEQLLCMATPETARRLFDRDKMLNPLAIFEVGLEQDDYTDDDPDDVDEEELLKLAAEEELVSKSKRKS
jgi:hypothetical protein